MRSSNTCRSRPSACSAGMRRSHPWSSSAMRTRPRPASMPSRSCRRAPTSSASIRASSNRGGRLSASEGRHGFFTGRRGGSCPGQRDAPACVRRGFHLVAVRHVHVIPRRPLADEPLSLCLQRHLQRGARAWRGEACAQHAARPAQSGRARGK